MCRTSVIRFDFTGCTPYSFSPAGRKSTPVAGKFLRSLRKNNV